MTERDTHTLFVQALNVINAALDRNRDDLPYKQILAASEKLLDGRELGVAVYGDDPGAPFDFFTVRYEKGRFEFVGRGKQDPDAIWKVSKDYLTRVAGDPDTYVEHPEKLDWDWLKSRLGL